MPRRLGAAVPLGGRSPLTGALLTGRAEERPIELAPTLTAWMRAWPYSTCLSGGLWPRLHARVREAFSVCFTPFRHPHFRCDVWLLFHSSRRSHHRLEVREAGLSGQRPVRTRPVELRLHEHRDTNRRKILHEPDDGEGIVRRRGGAGRDAARAGRPPACRRGRPGRPAGQAHRPDRNGRARPGGADVGRPRRRQHHGLPGSAPQQGGGRPRRVPRPRGRHRLGGDVVHRPERGGRDLLRVPRQGAQPRGPEPAELLLQRQDAAAARGGAGERHPGPLREPPGGAPAPGNGAVAGRRRDPDLAAGPGRRHRHRLPHPAGRRRGRPGRDRAGHGEH